MPRMIAQYPRRRRKPRDPNDLRYYVRYNLTYEGMNVPWTGHYKTLFGAKVAIFMNKFINSDGGSAVLYERDSWANGQRNRKGL